MEMSDSEEKKKSSRGWKLAIILLIVLVIVLLTVILVLCLRLSTKGAKQEVCVTEECILAATQVIQSMDNSADPCDSFYEYACGGWMKSHTVPSDRSNLYTYGVMRDEVLLKLKGIFEEPIEEDELEVFKNVKRLYQSCVDEEMIENRTFTVIVPLLEELGGWPLLGDSPGGQWKESDFDLVRLLLSLLKYSNEPLVYPRTGLDDLNNTKYTIFIDQPYLWLPNKGYYLDTSLESKLQAYRTMIRDTAVMMGASETTIDDDVNDLIKLETDIAKIIMPSEDRRDWTALYNPMPIKELQKNFSESFTFSGQSSNNKYKFDWLKYLQGAMAIPDEKVNITEDEEIVVVAIPYYKQLWNVLSGHSKRTVANYVISTIVLYRLNNLPERFRNLYQQFRKVMYGSQTARDRWKTCAQYAKQVEKMIVGRQFVDRYFDEKSKTEAVEMIRYIREAFYEQVDNLDWMDDEMKKVARKKAAGIVSAVGYPDKILNDTVLETEYKMEHMDSEKYFENVLAELYARSKNDFAKLRKKNDVTNRVTWWSSPANVNAYYRPQTNQITFPAAILQPPDFQNGRPRAMNYGAIGFFVGHEITHAFDNTGRQYDEIGNLFNWWTEEAADAFKEKAQCLVDQYSNYYWSKAGLNVNGLLTEGENIADNGGIKQAYKGYKNWQQSNSEPDLTLPGIDFNHDQLFFLSFAQSRCGVSRKDSAVNQILTDSHSPSKFRVDGSLGNMPEFSSVFKCPLNSKMNIRDKCGVW